MQGDPVSILVANENIHPLQVAYDEWVQELGETNYTYPPHGPGKLVGNKEIVLPPPKFLGHS